MANYQYRKASENGSSGYSDPQLLGPVQGPPEPKYINTSIENEPIDLDGEVKKNKEEITPSDNSSNFSDQDKMSAARFATGATPALLSMLFGASPLSAEASIQETEKRFTAGTPQHLGMTVGPGGKPVYEDIRNLPGKEAYVKPLRPVSGGLPKSIIIEDPKDPRQPKNAAFDPIKGAVIDLDTKEVIPNARPYTPASIQRGVGPGGEQIAVPLNARTGSVIASPTAIAAGEAQQKGMGTKEMEQGYKVSTDVAKERTVLAAKKADINNSIGLMNINSPTDKLLGVANTLKNLAQQGMADKTALPFAPPGLFQRAQDTANTLLSGNIDQAKINDAKSVLIEINKSLEEQDAALVKNYSQAAKGIIAPRPAQPKIEVKAPLIDARDHSDARAAMTWANSHPNDPRAQAIFKKFGR